MEKKLIEMQELLISTGLVHAGAGRDGGIDDHRRRWVDIPLRDGGKDWIAIGEAVDIVPPPLLSSAPIPSFFELCLPAMLVYSMCISPTRVHDNQ